MVRQGCVSVRKSEKCDFYNVQIVSVPCCSVHGWYSCSTPGASLHKCRGVTTKCSIRPTHVRNNKPSVKWVSCLLDYLHSMTSWKSGSLLDYLLLSILIGYIFLNLHSSPLPSSTDITLTVFCDFLYNIYIYLLKCTLLYDLVLQVVHYSHLFLLTLLNPHMLQCPCRKCFWGRSMYSHFNDFIMNISCSVILQRCLSGGCHGSPLRAFLWRGDIAKGIWHGTSVLCQSAIFKPFP